MSNAEVVLSKKFKNPKRTEDKPFPHVNPFMQFKQKENQSVYWVVETNYDKELFRERLQRLLEEHKEVRVTRMETTEATKFYLNSAPENRVSSTAVVACTLAFNPAVFEEIFEGCNYFKPTFKNKKTY